MTVINRTIQPFHVKAFREGSFLDVSHENLLGKWNILFFYPADFTFVCPTELADLATQYEAFRALGVEVYAVSTDTHFTHKAWHSSSPAVRNVRFPMLADPAHVLATQFEVLRPGQGLADRATFLLDPSGTVQVAEYTCEGAGRSALELLRKTKAAQYVAAHPGQVCPAQWEEGGETLTPSLDLVGKL